MPKLYPMNIESLDGPERLALIDQARHDYAEEQLDQGNQKLLQQEYIAASKHYYNAINSIQKKSPLFDTLREKSIHLLCQSLLLIIAEDHIKPSEQSSESSRFVNKILTKSYPDYYYELIVLSKKFLSNSLHVSPISQKVKDYLIKGELSYTQEAWEDSLTNYKKAYFLDKKNPVALLALDLIAEKEKRDITMAKKSREDMILDIEKSWKIPDIDIISDDKVAQVNAEKSTALSEKLESLIISEVNFYYIPITEALKEIKKQAYLADISEKNLNKKGVNIVLNLDLNKGKTSEPNIHLCLRNLPLGEVLKYLANQANLKISIEPYALVLRSIDEDESNEPLLVQEYKVPPNFFSFCSENEKGIFNVNAANDCAISEKEALISQGVTFPKHASAHFFSENNILIVKNTSSNLKLIAELIKNAIEHPPLQVEIEARFVEVKQNALEEKGFNWLLGSFPIGKNAKSGGGTVANPATYHPQNYPIQQNGVPVGTISGGPPGAGSVTSGNRLGANAITLSTLETLLGGCFPQNAGILALAGVLTNPQFQVVLRALNQKKGVNLISSPKITVSNGKKATITVARDFPYPDQYLPPQVPQNQSGGINPAIPATPASFKRRNVGVELEVKPFVNSTQKIIDLQLAPQIVEFQGFVNYGNPIFSQAPSFIGIGKGIASGSTTQVLLTENTINQPIFSVRQVNTQVALSSGQTIVLGGLIREDVQKVNDKTPIIGDIPVVGKLFRSSSEQHIKRNLLIFVTVWLIDPEGRKIKNN